MSQRSFKNIMWRTSRYCLFGSCGRNKWSFHHVTYHCWIAMEKELSQPHCFTAGWRKRWINRDKSAHCTTRQHNKLSWKLCINPLILGPTSSNWKIIFVLNSLFTGKGYSLLFHFKLIHVKPRGTASK